MFAPSSLNLFDNESDFWTTDDESDEDEQEEELLDNTYDYTNGELSVNPEENQTNLVDHNLTTESITSIIDGDHPRLVNETEDNNLTKVKKPGYVRKKWVIEDKSDTSDFHTRLPDLALKFPFELDPFQKRAILHLEQNHHVFVAAHTSAGKTVIAEYSIALALRRQRRAIYTSPIKALSNQKYLEFTKKFNSVGIVTGDVSINPDASCVIMTTEILRSAIYSSNPIIDQLDTVIFDEIHYINDAERGVVWEEVILLLPSNVTMVLLSATAPNYREFADWIGRARQRVVFAVLTLHRPVPLKHYLYYDDKAFLLMDSSEKFKTQAYNELYQYSRRKTHKTVTSTNKKGANTKTVSQKSIYQTNQAKHKTDTRRMKELITTLEKEKKLPVVIFSFSRKGCEDFALFLAKTKFITPQEESSVHIFIKKSLTNLNSDDRQLPQIQIMEELLMNGVGVHHGGLLPIMKEIVEMLFSKGLIKILFATETFAMGVNMPARSVIFSTIEKHDGTKTRFLQPSEYTQMSGRAGRRGLDDFGFVYIFSSVTPPDQRDLTMMMIHKSSPLISQFRVTFLMILQLFNTSSLQVEDMMSKSFRESSRLLKHDVAERDYRRYLKRLSELPAMDCFCANSESIELYINLVLSCHETAYELHKFFWNDNQKSRIFCPGRVIVAHSLPSVKGSCTAIILSTDSQPIYKNDGQPTFTCFLLLSGHKLSHPDPEDLRLIKSFFDDDDDSDATLLAYGSVHSESIFYNNLNLPDQLREYRIYKNVKLNKISMLTTTIVTEAEKLDIDDDVLLKVIANKVEKLEMDRENPLVPLASDKKFKNVLIHFLDIVNEQRKNYTLINQNPCHYCPKKEEHFQSFLLKQQYQKRIREIQYSLKSESLECYRSMKEKIRILEMLGFINSDNTLTLKGQVACLVMTGDDIILPEIIFDNCLNDLSPEEIAGLLGAFVGVGTTKEEPIPTLNLLERTRRITTINDRLVAILPFDKLEMNKISFAQMFNPNFVFISYIWAMGTPFYEIMQKTSTLQEGTIVRSLLRLDEILKRIKLATVLMGNFSLEDKLQLASEKIHRDIIFNMSLYLQ